MQQPLDAADPLQTDPAQPGGPFAPQRAALSLGILISVLLIAFESLAVATVLPEAARALDGLRLYGWSFSAFFVGFMLSTVGLGAWADRSGPARPYLLALLCFGGGLLLAGLSARMGVFIAGRTLQGFGGGGMVAVAYLAIGRAYPDRLRAQLLALMSGAWVLPGLVGPLLASLIAGALGWRGVFLGLLPLLLLAGALTLPPLLRLPAAGTPVRRRRLVAVGLAAAGVTLLLSALTRPALWPGLPLGLAGLALALPALRTLYPPGAWRLPTPLSAGYAARALLAGSFFGSEALVPLSLQELRGLSLLDSGLALTAATLGWAACAQLNARLDSRSSGGRGTGRLRPLIVGLGGLAVAVSLWTTDLLLHSQLPPALVAVSWALGGCGMGFAFQAHTLVVLEQAGEGQQGEVSGTLQLSDMLGSALGAGVGGALVAALGVNIGSGVQLALMGGMALGVVGVGRRLGAPRGS